jgi:hypothetical protein
VDTAIYSVDDGDCVADRMASGGVYWRPTDRDPGSRQNGWEVLRELLKNVMKAEGPRLFIFDTCRQFIRTIPVLPRDEIDRDDVDSAAENHVGDAGSHPTDERERQVPQPLRVSLSLWNTRFWNHDRLFESGGGQTEVGQRSREAGAGRWIQPPT